MTSSGRLTTRQTIAIGALLSERDQRAAAKLAGVGERTLYRWLNDDRFRSALAAAEAAAIDTATRRLAGLQAAAVDALENILLDPQTADGIRLRAAQAVLDYLLKLRELRTIEERLARLEREVLNHAS